MLMFPQSMVVYRITSQILRTKYYRTGGQVDPPERQKFNASYERQVCQLTLDLFTCLQCPSYLHAPLDW